MPGFVRALTHEDVPHNVYTILGLIGVEPEEEFVLPVDRVRYKGEPIVAILAETEAAAYEAVATGPARPRGAARGLRHGRGARAGRPDRDPLGQQHVHVRGPPLPSRPLRRRRGGLRAGGPHRRGRVPDQPHRARAARDDGLHRRPRAERPVHGLHEHPGALLQPRQHLDHPPGARQPAPVHRRHGRRRLRRQGRRHRGAARDAGRHEDRPAGPLRLQPLRGDAGQLHAQPRDHPDQGWRHGRRHDRRAQGHRATWTAAPTAARRRTRSPSSPPTRPAPTGSPTSRSTATASTPTARRRRAMRGFGVTMGSFAIEVQMDKIAERVGVDPWTDPVPQRATATATSSRTARPRRTRR